MESLCRSWLVSVPSAEDNGTLSVTRPSWLASKTLNEFAIGTRENSSISLLLFQAVSSHEFLGQL